MFTCYKVGRDSNSLRPGQHGYRIPVEVKFSAPVQTGPGAYPASYEMGTGPLSRGQIGRSVAWTTNTHLAQRLKKESSYTSTLPLGLDCLFQGKRYVDLLLLIELRVWNFVIWNGVSRGMSVQLQKILTHETASSTQQTFFEKPTTARVNTLYIGNYSALKSPPQKPTLSRVN